MFTIVSAQVELLDVATGLHIMFDRHSKMWWFELIKGLWGFYLSIHVFRFVVLLWLNISWLNKIKEALNGRITDG